MTKGEGGRVGPLTVEPGFTPNAALIRNAEGLLVASCDVELGSLLAAAPDLLAACEAMTQSLRTFRSVPKDEQEFVTFDEDALQAGFDAIAKAKGD